MKKIFFLVLMFISQVSLATPDYNVGGITFNYGDNFQIGSIWETADTAYGNHDNLINAVGDRALGIGFIDSIKDPTSAITWQSGNNGVDLAFTFQYDVTARVVVNSSITQLTFDNGIIDFYIIPAGSFSTAGATFAADKANIESGTPFVNYIGESFTATLVGSSAIYTGLGSGYLNVDLAGSGAANALFDTNTMVDIDNHQHDTLFNSSFKNAAVNKYTVRGSIDMYDNVARIEEPGILSLLGVGLIMIGWTAKKSRRKSIYQI